MKKALIYILSSILFVGYIVILYLSIKPNVSWKYSKNNAILYIILATFGMYTFYFSSTYTEALYLLCIVGFVYAMKKEKYEYL